MANKMTVKQKIMTSAIGVAGLAFVVHSVGMLTGWYDLAPIYEALNVNPAEFGWTTISAPGAYLVARVGLDGFKSNQKYKAELDAFNTTRIVDAQARVEAANLLNQAETAATNLKLDRNYQAQVESNELMKQILANDEAKAEMIKQLELNLPDATEEL